MTKSLMLVLIFSAQIFAGDLQIDKGLSWIKARAQATSHEFEAVPSKYECKLTMDGDKLIGAEMSFSVLDIRTAKEKRDTEMFHWLESEKFAQVQFKMTEMKVVDGRSILVGQFTLHNVTKTLEIPVTVKQTGPQTHIAGEVNIDTTQYGLPIIKKMLFLKVDPILHITFEMIGKE